MLMEKKEQALIIYIGHTFMRSYFCVISGGPVWGKMPDWPYWTDLIFYPLFVPNSAKI